MQESLHAAPGTCERCQCESPLSKGPLGPPSCLVEMHACAAASARLLHGLAQVFAAENSSVATSCLWVHIQLDVAQLVNPAHEVSLDATRPKKTKAEDQIISRHTGQVSVGIRIAGALTAAH